MDRLKAKKKSVRRKTNIGLYQILKEKIDLKKKKNDERTLLM